MVEGYLEWHRFGDYMRSVAFGGSSDDNVIVGRTGELVEAAVRKREG